MTTPPTSDAAPASPLGTAEPWDLVATAYETDVLPYFTLYARDALARAAVGPGARVADVAAGPGTVSLLAAAAGARVSAIDISPRMVEGLRARAAAAGAADAIDARVGDGEHLPFESAAYDAAFSMFGLMFFPDRVAGMRELRRVLRPGGRAIVSSWVPFEGPFGVLMKTATELVSGLSLGQGKPPLGDPEDFRREMTEAGFATVSIETVVHELESPSFDAFWDSMERSNAPLVLLRNRLAGRWTSLAPKIRERVRQTLGEGPLVIGRGAYFGVGVA